MHGRDHRPGGMDPIPGMMTAVPNSAYTVTGAIPANSNISLDTGFSLPTGYTTIVSGMDLYPDIFAVFDDGTNSNVQVLVDGCYWWDAWWVVYGAADKSSFFANPSDFLFTAGNPGGTGELSWWVTYSTGNTGFANQGHTFGATPLNANNGLNVTFSNQDSVNDAYVEFHLRIARLDSNTFAS